ncbi:MAG: helix-turn-helix domain-containing protein [Clostridiales bacterium]|nr:helix-turn-helix domain-containing protein [Clostridiales bacterium]
MNIGPVEVNVNSYEAYEHGQRVDLTLKELELLKVLMSSSNIVFSRQRLLDLVWGYYYFGDERVVDAHIKNLRKKLRTNLVVTVKPPMFLDRLARIFFVSCVSLSFSSRDSRICLSASSRASRYSRNCF